MKERVLLVGCGDIGSRHLQALAALPQVGEIEVVDPRPAAIRLGQDRLSEIPDCQPLIKFRWLTSLEQATPSGGLCIIATQASGRYSLVREVAEKLGHRSFLLEKVVSQSTMEYRELMAYTKSHGLSVWVNCKTRAYPFHQRMQPRFDPGEPIQLSLVAGNHGLLSNGIHLVDLFVFYDRSRTLNLSGARIDPTLHPSKRGSDLFDLSGSLLGYSDKGSCFTMTFAADHAGPPLLVVSSKRCRFTLDHWQRWAYESDAASGWAWRPTPFDGNLRISEMTKDFVANILQSGQCLLPKLDECYLAHVFLLDSLQPYFNELLAGSTDRCPVT